MTGLGNFTGSQIVATTLWSMAVLRVLSVEDFLLLEPVVQRLVGAVDRLDIHPFVVGRMRQILLEMRIQAMCRRERKVYVLAPTTAPLSPPVSPVAVAEEVVEGEVADLTQVSAKTTQIFPKSNQSAAKEEIINAHDILNAEIAGDVYQRIFTEREWERVRHTSAHITSSKMHIEVSQCLNKMGERHENEKMLEYGMVVDIFMSTSQYTSLVPPVLALSAVSPSSLLSTAHASSSSSSSKDRSDGKPVRSSLNQATAVTEESCRGIVIEVDGPYHFDSYLNVSVIYE